MGAHVTKIFLIDDDIIFCKGMQRALENEGDVDVSTFNTGEDFLNNLHNNPDIVIADYHLPGINGIEILKKVKQYNEDISIIVLSGHEKG